MLPHEGISKLGEEAAELAADCFKQVGYWGHDNHPVDNYSLRAKIEEEAGDVLGALTYAVKHFQLDWQKIVQRGEEKFQKWDKEPNT